MRRLRTVLEKKNGASRMWEGDRSGLVLHDRPAIRARAKPQSARDGSGFERRWPKRRAETAGPLLVRCMRASLSIHNQELLLDRFREI
jgi:hypothetical protein